MAGRLDQSKLAAARLAASARMPYLASAIFAARIVAEEASGTISMDRSWQLHADPAVVDGLDVETLARLVLHLTGHLLRAHAERAVTAGALAFEGPRTPAAVSESAGTPAAVSESAGTPAAVSESAGTPAAVSESAGTPALGVARWNRAADAEINDDLHADGLVPSVAPDLPSDLGCAPGGLVEQYFVDAREGPRRWDCGSAADGVARAGDGRPHLSFQDIELLRLGVAAAVQRQQAEQPGTVAGGWLRWAEQVLPSRTDWRRALAAEIRRGVAAVAGNVDYSYRRPSRRAVPGGRVILPSLRRPTPEVAIVCDTSGSMHEQLLARALAEVERILTRSGLRTGRVRVLAVDTDVQAVRRVSRAQQVDLAGGGGTNMGAGMRAAAELRPRPDVIVVLTDGHTPWPEAGPVGTKVVVGILAEGPVRRWQEPPAWATTIVIDTP